MYSIRFCGLVPWTERARGSVTFAMTAVCYVTFTDCLSLVIDDLQIVVRASLAVVLVSGL